MKEITKTLKIDSNIEEIKKRVEELADLINKANSIIEELAETELKVKLKI
jgi:prefoldin subunit 5